MLERYVFYKNINVKLVKNKSNDSTKLICSLSSKSQKY